MFNLILQERPWQCFTPIERLRVCGTKKARDVSYVHIKIAPKGRELTVDQLSLTAAMASPNL